MADPIISPDGKWMWTGSEWIPAPPSSALGADSAINLQDSMMSGDVNVEQNSNDTRSTINLKDSAIDGDINITQNNAEDIATAMVQALERQAQLADSSKITRRPASEAEEAVLNGMGGVRIGAYIGLTIEGEDLFGKILEFDDDVGTVTIEEGVSGKHMTGYQEHMFG